MNQTTTGDTMKTMNKTPKQPSEQAVRAAEQLDAEGRLNCDAERLVRIDEAAAVIDRETDLPRLLKIAEAARKLSFIEDWRVADQENLRHLRALLDEVDK